MPWGSLMWVRCELWVRVALSSFYKPRKKDLNWRLWWYLKDNGTKQHWPTWVLQSNGFVSKRLITSPIGHIGNSLFVLTTTNWSWHTCKPVWDKWRRHEGFSVVKIALMLTGPRKLRVVTKSWQCLGIVPSNTSWQLCMITQISEEIHH